MKNFSHKLKLKLQSVKKELQKFFGRDLESILDDIDLVHDLPSRILWLEELLDWVRNSDNPTTLNAEQEIFLSDRNQQHHERAIARFYILLSLFNKNQILKVKVAKLLLSILEETDALNLFCHTGFSQEPGFFSEAFERILRKFLPIPQDEKDLSQLFGRLFHHETEALALANLSESVLQTLLSIFKIDPVRTTALKAHYHVILFEALTLLSSQIESLGLSPEMRLRTHIGDIHQSAFFLLRKKVLLSQASSTQTLPDPEACRANLQSFLEHIAECKKEINSALKNLENFGVSLRLVFQLEKLEHLLDRTLPIVQLLYGQDPEQKTKIWLGFISELAQDTFKSSRIKDLFQSNTHLLARKIVESSSASGEHYIARSKKEYYEMLGSASGGGLLTAWTTWFKFLISHLHSAPFFEGLLSWINYSGSFLFMYICNFTLATKQPSMTAAALASKLRDLKTRHQVQEFVDEVARMTRSQFIAAVGNLGTVIPSVILLDYVIFAIFGHHVLGEAYAKKTISSIHPFESLSLLYAIETGVLLFISSLCAGWFENWFIYRRLPESLSQSPGVKFLFGTKNTKIIHSWLIRNVSGLSGCLSLGFLLAFTPIMGHFFGLPFDVRHVTLSTGALTFSICAIPFNNLEISQIFLGVLGILLIGLCNFGVSFILALFIAIRARQIHKTWLRQLAEAIWLRFLYRPFDFFFPFSQK